MNTSTASRPTPDYHSLLAEYDASGLSAAAFARSRGLEPWRIYNALNRRKGKARHRQVSLAADKPALLPVRVIPDASPARSTGTLELELAGGHRLHIAADFDPLLLRRVVEALSPC